MASVFSHEVEAVLKREFLGGAAGFYVEVGANDPEILSQTWDLEQLGWTGVLVEPQPDLAEKLRQQRRGKVYAVGCSSPENSGKTFILNLAGIHSSFDAEAFVPGMQKAGTAIVQLMTLDEVLEDAQAPVPLDFVSIDVERHELEVLSGFDLARWQPRLLLVEDMVLDLRLHRTLASRGYKWIRRTGLNGWYVPAAHPARVDLVGRLQFLRKYYLGVPFRIVRERLRRIRYDQA